MKYTITIEHEPLSEFPYTARTPGFIACGKTSEDAEKRLADKIKNFQLQEPTVTKEIEI